MNYKEDKNKNLVDEKGRVILKAEERQECEIYSRVVGFIRPIDRYNKGKSEEFKERKTYKI